MVNQDLFAPAPVLSGITVRLQVIKIGRRLGQDLAPRQFLRRHNMEQRFGEGFYQVAVQGDVVGDLVGPHLEPQGVRPARKAPERSLAAKLRLNVVAFDGVG